MLLNANGFDFMEFLQWFGVSGVAILTFFYTRQDKMKEKEAQFVDRLTTELEKREQKYEELFIKIENLEKVNDELRQKNIELIKENATLEVNRQKLEHELNIKIAELERSNKTLVEKINELSNNKYHKT